ncbi:UNVERIFIED_CONTAM: hypothetical protein O8I53_11195 [Campylobacter lari]
MKTIVQKVENEFITNSNVVFYEIDAEESKLYLSLDSKYQIFQIPAFAVVKGDKIHYNGYKIYPKEILRD